MSQSLLYVEVRKLKCSVGFEMAAGIILNEPTVYLFASDVTLLYVFIGFCSPGWPVEPKLCSLAYVSP